LALFILNDLEKEEAASLSEALISVKENLSFCEICGVIKEDACPICQDNKRDQSTIMVLNH